MALFDGITSYFEFEDDSGNATDGGGVGDLINNGMTQGTTGKILSGATNSGGATEYMSTTTNIMSGLAGNDFTVATWVKFDSVASFQYAVHIGDDIIGTADEYISLANSSGVARAQIKAAGAAELILTGGTITAGTWHNMVFTKVGTTYTLYLDGVAVDTGTIILPDLTATFDGGGTYIFDNSRLTNHVAAGSIDMLYVWNGTGKSAAEVTELYNDGTGTSFALSELLSKGLHSYNFDEASGSLADGYGGTSGTNNGATYGGTGVLGTALDFDGVNDYVDLPKTVEGSTSITVNAWAKQSVQAGVNTIISQDGVFRIMDNAGTYEAFFDIGATRYTISGVAADTNWHMHTLTYDGATVEYFIDAVSQGTQAVVGTIDSSAFGQHVGRWSSGGLYFQGTIDEVSTFTSLTPIEVEMLYNSGSAISYPFVVATQQQSTLNGDSTISLRNQSTLNGDATIVFTNQSTLNADATIQTQNQSTLDGGRTILVLQSQASSTLDGTATIGFQVLQTLNADATVQISNQSTLNGTSTLSIVDQYAEAEKTVRAVGLDAANLPKSLTIADVNCWLQEATQNIDAMLCTTYGQLKNFEYITNSRYANVGWIIDMPYRYLSDIQVFFRNSIENETYTQLTAEIDYRVKLRSNKIQLYRIPTLSTREISDIKVTGKYGELTIPTEIEQLTRIIVGIRIMTYLTGGSFDDVTSYQLGEYSESLGEPFTNLNATIKQLEDEKDRLMRMTGLGSCKTKMRLI